MGAPYAGEKTPARKSGGGWLSRLGLKQVVYYAGSSLRMFVNAVFTRVPKLSTVATTTAAISAAIMPYSRAVTPSSSAMNDRTAEIIVLMTYS